VNFGPVISLITIFLKKKKKNVGKNGRELRVFTSPRRYYCWKNDGEPRFGGRASLYVRTRSTEVVVVHDEMARVS